MLNALEMELVYLKYLLLSTFNKNSISNYKNIYNNSNFYRSNLLQRFDPH